ncbi:hypothetical protein P7K49_039519 [Saguinus oedipus]|uniref:Uncharacterized protein n=1 Tax=Saguinus oedipus TaxID=9490 RepID=A0ABQ9TC29_SAGOE|nr:hypothetical protein P7K49_039519 [Saguinus oedipus]
MGNCLGRGACLCCTSCQQAVAPSCECETQSVAAAAPASTTAEPAVLHPGVVEVQHVQPIKSKRHKGKEATGAICSLATSFPSPHPRDILSFQLPPAYSQLSQGWAWGTKASAASCLCC